MQGGAGCRVLHTQLTLDGEYVYERGEPSLCTSCITGLYGLDLWISNFSRVPRGISHTKDRSAAPSLCVPAARHRGRTQEGVIGARGRGADTLQR